MVQATDLSYLYSSQPNSSQNPPEEEAVERVFWQSTPTVLEELRREKDDKCHQARALLVSLEVVYHVLTRSYVNRR
jgi:hypothetical protein